MGKSNHSQKFIQPILLRLVLIAIIPLYTGPVDAAVHMIKKVTADVYIIQGEIFPKDIGAVKETLKEVKSKKVEDLEVRLDSPGGSVSAAMEIGRLLRSVNATTIVDDNSSCVSACVFIYAAGVHKIATGKIGIHRPYFSSLDDPSYSAVQKQFREGDSAIKAYLDEMNMPPSLYEAMRMVAPSSIRWLKRSELEKYGLWGFDPVYEEILDAAAAKSFGLSRALYYERNEIASNICWTEAERPARKGEKKDFLERVSACRERVLKTGK